MKEERFFFVPDAETRSELPEEEAVHAVRVLRLQAGDEMTLMDGQGCFYHTQVTLATQKHCRYRILERRPQSRPWPGSIHLAIAPTKLMERMEWMAEKATEVGLDELTFLDCRFSERRVLKQQRIEKIVVSAVKQSRKAWMPRLNGMTDFRQFVDSHTEGRRFIAHCYNEVERVSLFGELQKGRADDDVLVMVGPEGDFSIDEVGYAVAHGFISVDLGQSRLRTETAGLVSVMMMHLGRTAQP